MDYGKIISTGWSQAWKHKTLWILGFLVSGGGGANLPNFSEKFDNFGLGPLGQRDLYQIEQFIMDNLHIVVLLAALLFVVFLIWLVLSMIATGGLIDAARQMKNNETYGFGKAFRVGVENFWRILGISVLTFIVAAAFVIFMVLIGVAAFLIHWGIGVLALLILLPILLVGIFVIAITVAMAERYIVIRNQPVFDSLADGYNLWKSNLGSSVVFGLIYIGLSIAIGLITLVIILFTVVPFIAIGFVNWLVAVLIGLPIVLLILLVVEGFTGSAMHLMGTEFYYQLVEKSQPAAVPMAETGDDYIPPPPVL